MNLTVDSTRWLVHSQTSQSVDGEGESQVREKPVSGHSLLCKQDREKMRGEGRSWSKNRGHLPSFNAREGYGRVWGGERGRVSVKS